MLILGRLVLLQLLWWLRWLGSKVLTRRVGGWLELMVVGGLHGMAGGGVGLVRAGVGCGGLCLAWLPPGVML